MSDPGDFERSDGEHGGLSRRDMLRLGMLALSATQLPRLSASAQGVKPGANLIGKLEGAEVVTDPAQFPKSFKEAPQLAELVKAGKLPPVAASASARTRWSSSRCARSASTAAPGAAASPGRATSRTATASPQNDKLLFWDYTGTKIVPNIAKGWDVSADGKVTTLHLRRGMKWSDGAAVHRRRLRVLVRGHLPEQGPRADAARRS